MSVPPSPFSARMRAYPVGARAQYIAVIVLIGLCVLLRMAMDPVLDQRAVLITFVPALLAIAWFFGRGPFIAGAALALLATDYFFDSATGRLFPRDSSGLLTVLIYIAAVVGIGLVVTPARAAVDRARRAEQEQARADTRAAHVLENMGDLFIAVDGHWRITYINAATRKYLRGPAEAHIGQSLWDVAPQLAGSELQTLARSAMEHRQRLTTETFGEATQRYFEVTFVPDAEDGLSIFGRDVHEQRLVERSLADSDRRIGRLVDELGDCFMAINHDWRITAINASGAAFAKTTPAGAVGREFWEVFSSARGTLLEPVLRRAMMERESSRHEVIGPTSGRIFDMTLVPTAEGLSCFARDVTTLRRAAQVAGDEQRKLRTLIDAMPALVAQMDRDLRYVVANRTYREWFGVETADVEGRYIWEVSGQEAYERLKPYIARVLAGEEVRYEALVPHKDGPSRWTDVTLVPNRDGAGEVVGYFVLVQDVSNRRLQAEELRKANERLEIAQAAARLGTFEWEIDTSKVVWTESLERIHGLAPGTFEGTVEAALRDMHPGDAPEAQRRIEAALAAEPKAGEEAGYHNEYRIIRPDGSTRWIEAHARIVRDPGGRPIRLVGVCADVSDRRAAEEARRESEERFRVMADAAPVLVWVADSTRMCTWFNRGWVEFTGRSLEQLTGEGWTADIHPDDRDRCLRICKKSSEAREPHQLEYRLRHHGGDYRWVLDHGVPRRGADGEFLGYIGSCVDITERKNAEEAVTRHAEELIRSNQDLESFAYIVSHDLKEPLRGISNYSRFLMEDEGDNLSDEGRQKALTIQRLCRRGYDLLDALLDFSRVGRARLKVEEVDLSALARQAGETLSAALLDSEKTGEGEAPAPGLIIMPDMAMVKCDPVLVSQVLTNLIANGLKYNHNPHPRVHVGMMPQEDGQPPVFFVRDNGIGIDSRYHAAIFRMFKRLHARDTYGGGLGAGLAIVRRVVERHGGRIWLESTPGEGTTFLFTLAPDPVRPAPKLALDGLVMEPAPAPKHGKHAASKAGGGVATMPSRPN